jgi:nucleoside-diphosphate-sugar epimerase
MPDKRVLVTGAGGFIGRYSIAPLLTLGYDVHAVLSDHAGGGSPQELGGASVHRADLLNAAQVDDLLSAVRPTHLLHFAWIATPGIYWQSSDNNRWVAASEHLLRAFHARGGSRVMMAGTCAEYDWARVQICDEVQSPLAMGEAVSRYAECKIALQAALADFGRREQLSTAWGRIFFQFGPYEHPERLVPSVICNLLSNREAPASHGRQVRSFLHVADVGAAFAAVLHGQVEGPVNIGSADRISLAELIERIARRIGRPDLVRLGARPASAGEPVLLVPEIHRLRDEAGWRPRFTLDEALDDTIEWWRGRLLERAGAASQT